MASAVNTFTSSLTLGLSPNYFQIQLVNACNLVIKVAVCMPLTKSFVQMDIS